MKENVALASLLAPSEARGGPGHPGPDPFHREALQRAAEDGHWFPCHLPSQPPRRPALPLGQDGADSFRGQEEAGTSHRGAGSGSGWEAPPAFPLSARAAGPLPGLSPRYSAGVGRLLPGKVFVSSAGKSPSSDENKLQSPQRGASSEVSARLTTWVETMLARPAMWNPLEFPQDRTGRGQLCRLCLVPSAHKSYPGAERRL